jgi:hypothetical protein
MYPNMSYHSVPGLVALFAKTVVDTQNPRAPHSRPLAASGFSYATIVRPPAMDSGRFNGGNRGTNHCFGVAPSVQGSGQGSSFIRGGFQSGEQGFHPSYAGRGSYTCFGGGRYGGRGRPSGRPPTHHPGFATQRGRDSGGVEAHQGQVAGQGRGVGGFDAHVSADNGRMEQSAHQSAWASIPHEASHDKSDKGNGQLAAPGVQGQL